MGFLIDLWMPIILASVLVFMASSFIHMVLTIHKKDYSKLNGEDEILAVMRDQGIKPGDYMLPYCVEMKAMGTEEMQAKFKAGPVGFMTIMPSGMWSMGKTLSLWFLFIILINIFVAYLTNLVFTIDTDYAMIFRFVATVSLLPYALGALPNSIWRGLSWATTSRFIFDGTVYALLTASTFTWLWPSFS